MRNLPPLTAIKAFEAAARHGSVKLAANELHVTAAAATEQVRGHQRAGSLRLTALPSFAHGWLLPRLARFQASHPDIDLVLDTDSVSQNLMGKKFDLAIRSGTGRWPGMQADLIAHEAFAPMCSPALLAGAPPLSCPDDLRGQQLIHSTPRDGWARWLELAGVSGVDTSKGMTLNDSSLGLQLAMEGQGVVLGRTFLAAAHLASGKLVMPFAGTLDNDFSYWLVYPTASAALPRLQAFRAWLLAELALPAAGAG